MGYTLQILNYKVTWIEISQCIYAIYQVNIYIRYLNHSAMLSVLIQGIHIDDTAIKATVTWS